MPKKLEVEVKEVDGLYEAKLGDGTKFVAPSKEDVKTLATWVGTRPVWNKEKKLYEGTQYGESVAAATLQELQSKVAMMPDEATFKTLSNMPEYPTLYMPAPKAQFDKRVHDMMNCYEDVAHAKAVAAAAGNAYVFELLVPKAIIKEIDRQGGVFKIVPADVPSAAVKRALKMNGVVQSKKPKVTESRSAEPTMAEDFL